MGSSKQVMEFGDRFVNPFASNDNPHKVGYFVRWKYRKGRLNPGKQMELTNKIGDFWELPAKVDLEYETMYGTEALKLEKAFIATNHSWRRIMERK